MAFPLVRLCALSVALGIAVPSTAAAQGSGSAVLLPKTVQVDPVPKTEGAAISTPAKSTPTATTTVTTTTTTTPTVITVPDPAKDPEGFLQTLLRAATSGAWKSLAGLVLVGLAFITRTWILGKVAWFQTKLGGVTIAVTLSLASTFGLAWATGVAVTATLAANALSTAIAAAGLWQWLQAATQPKQVVS